MQRFCVCLVLIFMIPVMALGQEDFNKVAATGAQFLKIEIGARATAMGGAYAALATGPEALYWNVAGAAKMKQIAVGFTFDNWISDFNHSFTALLIPAGESGTIGFSVLTLTSGRFEQTTIDQPRGTGTMVSASDLAVGFSYSRAMTNFVSVGITAKFIQQKLWNVTAKTAALDIGFLLDTGFKGIKLGMVLNNFGPQLRLNGRDLVVGYDKWPENNSDPKVESELKTAPWPLPTSYRASVAIPLVGRGGAVFEIPGQNQLQLIAEFLHPNDNPEHYSFGLEYALWSKLFARAGYKAQTDEQGFSLGAGIQLPVGQHSTLVFDYAFIEFGIFENVQQFSLSYIF